MATIRLQVVTPERVVLEDDADIVIARGAEGDLGILYGHEPLITPLDIGELMYRKDGAENVVAVSGGFLEVRPDKVIVLGDVAERSEDIDEQRAQAARDRAEAEVREKQGTEMAAAAEASLQRALLRIRVAGRRHHREQ